MFFGTEFINQLVGFIMFTCAKILIDNSQWYNETYIVKIAEIKNPASLISFHVFIGRNTQGEKPSPN